MIQLKTTESPYKNVNVCQISLCKSQAGMNCCEGASTFICFYISLSVMWYPGSSQSPSFRDSGHAVGCWEIFGALVPKVF